MIVDRAVPEERIFREFRRKIFAETRPAKQVVLLSVSSPISKFQLVSASYLVPNLNGG